MPNKLAHSVRTYGRLTFFDLLQESLLSALIRDLLFFLSFAEAMVKGLNTELLGFLLLFFDTIGHVFFLP